MESVKMAEVTLKFKDQTYHYNENTGIQKYVHRGGDERKNYMYCLNCNKKGHTYKICRFPTNSYGCVIFKKSSDGLIRYLMIQRRYTPIYVELLRGKYKQDQEYLVELVKDLPYTERNYILKHDFDYLWENLWSWSGSNEQIQCIVDEYKQCKDMFNHLKNAPLGQMSWESLFNEYPATRIEPEWEFPKGRRNSNESDQQCAIREAMEETTLNKSDYQLYRHVKPFQEKFTGENQIRYCNSYYLGKLVNHSRCIYYNPNHKQQNKEVRKIGWFSDEEIKTIVRDIQDYRLTMFNDINKLVNNMMSRES